MTEHDTNANYLVLARKHRPASFSGLIGQDAMVRTLKNAIATGRLAQAFILTGVRGVGKTTTARIIARALNCVGPDGTGGPTVEPCGVCEHCRSIAEDRHVDVIEMDAASRTGVDDIRELIEGVRYRPVSARYKVYIIDEVHMLSKQAFNALLKTLEEPPEHVKFIFATTEVRRVPVTVLSRCQRFDLKRVEPDVLGAHLTRIAEQEGARIAPEAVALLARAADGSVRDGLSLLDTAIAHGPSEGNEAIGEDQIREMLGLADRSLVIDLFDRVMAGEIPSALDQLSSLYASGADPVVVMQDLLDVCHWLTRLKLVPGAAESPEVPAAERKRGAAMADKLSLATLARAWQMLLKGLSEVQVAPTPLAAAEMVLVRLGYAAELPNPAELVQRMAGGAGAAAAPGNGGPPATKSAPGRRSESSESYADERPRAYSG
ncbi:MAG TPA: DNA polymerase III subunit gamma/tau, partial [Alphaproteobacteria bacterium]|nr:DNA polymerase III subunit gamma/tau [Alphaproteobacteria bacterium]